MACSMPPMYWSTGIQCRAISGSKGASVRPRVAEPQEVPRRVDERVHGVGLAVAGPPHAGHVVWRNAARGGQRRLPGGQELDVVGREDGELVRGHRHDAVVGAVDDGDRAAPEALAGHQPVAEAVVDGAHADAPFLEPLDGPLLGHRDVEAVEPVAVDLATGAGVGTAGPPSSQPSGGSTVRTMGSPYAWRSPSRAGPRPARP